MILMLFEFISFIKRISVPLPILIVNFACLGFAFYNGQNRGVVNIDYLFSIFFVGNKFLFIAYGSIIAAIDIFIIFSKSYNFTPVSFIENWEMLHLISFGFNYALLIQIFLGLVAIVTINWCIFFILSNGVVSANKKICSLFVVAIILIDVMVGTFYTNGLQTEPIIQNKAGINPSTSGIASFVTETKTRYFSDKDNIELKPRESALYQSLNELKEENYPEKMVLIVVESYGLFKNNEINNYLMDEFRRELNKNYKVKFNKVKFSGATTSGEIRELCGVQGDSYGIKSFIEKHECLPGRLIDLGYKTSGFHYFYKSSFNRGVWWPKIGLSNIYFLDSYNTKKRKLCGGFLNGGCDRQLIIDLFNSIDSQSKSFSYALTLNSHLPVHRNDDIISIENNEVNNFDDASSNVKLLINSWRVVLQEVAGQLNNKIRDDALVVIVGDHAPPYLNKQDRSMFSTAEVPYIIVSSKNLKSIDGENK